MKTISYIFLVLFIQISFLIGNTNLISMTTEEFSDFRRILVQFPFDMNDNGYFPQLSENPEKGTFTIDITVKDSALYFGPQLVQESGRYPIRGRINRVNDFQIHFSFETIPFEKVMSWYVLGSEQFIFDVYKIVPVESTFMEKTIGLEALYKNKKAVQKRSTDAGTQNNLSFKGKIQHFISSSETRPLFIKALLFALLVVLIISILFMFLQLYTKTLLKKQKKLSNTNEKNEVKPTPVTKLENAAASIDKMNTQAEFPYDIPVLKTPEDRDRAIRKLMSSKNISYDEAAMILMMKPGNLNVKV